MYKIYYKSKQDNKYYISSWAETLHDARIIIKVNQKNGYTSLVYDEGAKMWYSATWDGEQVILKPSEGIT